MRVLYVNHTLEPSGASISLGTLVRHLGAEVDPWFLFRTGSKVVEVVGAPKERAMGWRWMPHFPTTVYVAPYGPVLWAWHTAKLAPAFLHFAWTVRRLGIQLVHLNETCLAPYAWFAAVLGLPVVMHARTVVNPRGLARRVADSAAVCRRLAVLCVDAETLASLPPRLKQRGRLAPNPIKIAPCADPEVRRRLRAEWGGDDASVFAGQVASLHEAKGVWQFLDVARAACAVDARLRFVLVGDDRPGHGLGPELKARAVEMGLQDRVVFAGYRPDLAAVYSALDVVTVLFGRGLGGIGRSAFEAGMMGLPVVATCPDVRSPMLFGGEAGRILLPDDTEGVTREVLALASSPEKRRALGARAKELLCARHDPVSYAREVVGLYRQLLAGGVSGQQ